MGPELQYANERSWDPLSFDVYPGDNGATEMRMADDHRDLRFTLTIDSERVLLEGGPLEYEAVVRVHRPGAPPVGGRLSESIGLREAPLEQSHPG